MKTDIIFAIEKLKKLAEKEQEEIAKNNKYRTEIYNRLENFIDRLETAESDFKYFEKEIIEGTLEMNSDERYELIWKEEDEYKTRTLSSGSLLEIRNPDIEDDQEPWLIGRVEHRDPDGYYFHGCQRPALYSGMKVRIRK